MTAREADRDAWERYRPRRRDVLGRGLALGLGAAVAPLFAPLIVPAGAGAGAARAATARAQDPDTAPGMRFIRIGTGSTAGYYFPVGGLIANAISRPPGARPCERGGSCGVPGLIAVAQSTGGSVDNVRGLATGALGLALCQADIAYWARTGTAVFADAGPMLDLFALARLYDEKAHLVVRADSDLYHVEDLRGRRIALGEAGSGTLVDARLLLAAHGMSDADVEPIYDKPGPSADLLVAGEIDAFFFIGAAPVTVVTDLAAALPVRLMPLDGAPVRAMADSHPYLTLDHIPGGVYAGIDTAVPTLSVGAVLIGGAALTESLAYSITRALWHPNTRTLFESVATAETFTPEAAPHGTGIPLHVGAQRYYEDAGYLP
ncbi:TAXI family TRAP transporter solute-binding subunit [Roseospira goensis]|uniref:TAXI family TRAP transporter solute-binding subunit n=1 Tax=Roseospira goensis TaxID=391922 RepID=A0A7W6RYX4_9PROT|nr:TAXI family TRAP transporter solute-binding subunit [Roseospira goensis]MBB4285788.1 hypothetical protein [Roseospira goensis]